MAIYAVKRTEETNERLIKRFKKQFQNARLLKEVRERIYRGKVKTKRITRKKALKREMFRAKKIREQFYA